MSAAPLPWEKYGAQTGAPWEKYGGALPSAASPIAPPSIPKPQMAMQSVNLIGGTSENPDVHRSTPESLGELGAHAIESTPNAVAIGHRVAQKAGIAPSGDIYPNELQMKEIPSAAAATFFGMGAEPGAEPPAITPRAPVSAPIAAPEAPGVISRVGGVLLRKIPGVKLGEDLLNAARGPQPIQPKPAPIQAAPVPAPETNGVPWGQRIPAKISPPVEQSAYLTQRKPIIEQRPVPGSKEDLAETKAIQEQVRTAAEGEDRTRLSQQKREWFARNAPGVTKGEMIQRATASAGKPAAKIAAPAPSDDLTPQWQAELERIRAQKAKK